MEEAELLLNQAELEQKQQRLDHRWAIRKFLATSPELTPETRTQLEHIALKPYRYVEQWRPTFEPEDLSLQVVTSYCEDCEAFRKINFEDELVTDLAEQFNQMVESGRKLHRCYDCGTMARTLFLGLIKAYRGQDHTKLLEPAPLSLIEREYLRQIYQPARYPVKHFLQGWKRDLDEMDRDCVAICSIGFGQFGHIWVMEKILRDERPVYRIFQSSLRAFMVLDALQLDNYGETPFQGIDLDQMDTDLQLILQPGDWSEPQLNAFYKWFHFDPPKGTKDPSFCYGVIAY